MSKLEELRKSILSMSRDEQMAMLRKVREDRKLSKAPIVKERKQVQENSKIVKMFEGLSDAEREALLAQLAESETE